MILQEMLDSIHNFVDSWRSQGVTTEELANFLYVPLIVLQESDCSKLDVDEINQCYRYIRFMDNYEGKLFGMEFLNKQNQLKLYSQLKRHFRKGLDNND